MRGDSLSSVSKHSLSVSGGGAKSVVDKPFPPSPDDWGRHHAGEAAIAVIPGDGKTSKWACLDIDGGTFDQVLSVFGKYKNSGILIEPGQTRGGHIYIASFENFERKFLKSLALWASKKVSQKVEFFPCGQKAICAPFLGASPDWEAWEDGALSLVEWVAHFDLLNPNDPPEWVSGSRNNEFFAFVKGSLLEDSDLLKEAAKFYNDMTVGTHGVESTIQSAIRSRIVPDYPEEGGLVRGRPNIMHCLTNLRRVVGDTALFSFDLLLPGNRGAISCSVPPGTLVSKRRFEAAVFAKTGQLYHYPEYASEWDAFIFPKIEEAGEQAVPFEFTRPGMLLSNIYAWLSRVPIVILSEKDEPRPTPSQLVYVRQTDTLWFNPASLSCLLGSSAPFPFGLTLAELPALLDSLERDGRLQADNSGSGKIYGIELKVQMLTVELTEQGLAFTRSLPA